MNTKILITALIFVLNSQAFASRNNVASETDASTHNSTILIGVVDDLNNENDFVSLSIKKGRNINAINEIASSDIHFTSGNTSQKFIDKNHPQGRNLKTQETIALTIVGRNKAVIDRIIALQTYELAKMNK